MLQRFASAALVAVIALAVAAVVVFFAPDTSLKQLSPILYAWCFVPCVWGLWAMAAPRSWVPHLLPLWGAVLGLLAGLFAIIVLDLPRLVFGIAISRTVRSFGVLAAIVFYYVLWTFVAAVYRRLAPEPVSAPTRSSAKAA